LLNTLYKRFYKNKDSHNKELIKGGASAFSVKLIGNGVNYIFTFVVARFFGAGGLGTYSIYQSVMQLSSNISKQGFNTLMVRYVAFYNAKNRWDLIKDLYYKSLRITIIIGIIASLILFFGADIIAQKIFLKPELSICFRIGAFTLLPWIMMELHCDSLSGLKMFFTSSFIRSVTVFIVAIIVVAASAHFIHNKALPVIAYSCGIVVASSIAMYRWLKSSKLPKTITEHVNMKEMSSIAFVLFSTSILYMIRTTAETAIIGRYCSVDDLGVYKVALKIASITAITLNAMLYSLSPKIAELHGKDDYKKLADVTQNTTTIIFWTSAPILVIFMLFPSFFMGLFGGEFKHSIGGKILIILSFGQFINCATGAVSKVLMMAGKHKLNRNLVLVATTICVGLNFIIIPRYGLVGAAWVNVIGFVLFNIVPFFYVKYHFGFYTISLSKIFFFKKLKSK